MSSLSKKKKNQFSSNGFQRQTSSEKEFKTLIMKMFKETSTSLWDPKAI